MAESYVFTASRLGVVRATRRKESEWAFHVVARTRTGRAEKIGPSRKQQHVMGIARMNNGVWCIAGHHGLLFYNEKWQIIHEVYLPQFNWIHSIVRFGDKLYGASCKTQQIFITSEWGKVLSVQNVCEYPKLIGMKGTMKADEYYHFNHIEPIHENVAIVSLAAVPAILEIDPATTSVLHVHRAYEMTHHPRRFGPWIVSSGNHGLLAAKMYTDDPMRQIVQFTQEPCEHIFEPRKRTVRGLLETEPGSFLCMDVARHCVWRVMIGEDLRCYYKHKLFRISKFFQGQQEYEVWPE